MQKIIALKSTSLALSSNAENRRRRRDIFANLVASSFQIPRIQRSQLSDQVCFAPFCCSGFFLASNKTNQLLKPADPCPRSSEIFGFVVNHYLVPADGIFPFMSQVKVESAVLVADRLIFSIGQ